MLRSDPVLGPAMTALHSTCPTPRGRPRDVQPFDLLRHAVAAIAEHASRGVAWPGSPLVIVAGEGPLGGRCLEDMHRACRPPAGSVVWDGRELGMELMGAGGGERLQRLRDQLLAGPLLAVGGLEDLGSGLVQRRFTRILDAATAAGTSVCVTMTSHPAAAAFIPRLASRLCAGLVVPVPSTGVPAAASGAAQGSAAGLSLATVIRTTARHLGLPAGHLVGQGRQRSIAQARSLAMYLARQLTGRSFTEIGKALGSRDHSTVIHGIRGATARLREDAGFAADAATITADLLKQPRLESEGRSRRHG